jgi:hypothetical protein
VNSVNALHMLLTSFLSEIGSGDSGRYAGILDIDNKLDRLSVSFEAPRCEAMSAFIIEPAYVTELTLECLPLSIFAPHTSSLPPPPYLYTTTELIRRRDRLDHHRGPTDSHLPYRIHNIYPFHRL